jgi:glycosyltransferase involved in cell wall biosynthesis
MQHPLYGIHLFYHGRLPKDQTITRMSKAQYTLMPSLFLETFGLVALDSLACGVPVIGEKKGGLTPFIIDEHLEISQQQSLYDCMQYILEHNTQTYLV